MRYSMHNPVFTVALCVAAAGVAGCVTPEPDSEPVRTPLDAMQTTPAPPMKDEIGPAPGLARDIEQLKDARTTYERAQESRPAHTRRQQARCRQSEDKKEIPIRENGSTTVTFCQQSP